MVTFLADYWFWLVTGMLLSWAIQFGLRLYMRSRNLSMRLHGLATSLEGFALRSASPADLRNAELFKEGVRLLGRETVSASDLAIYLHGDNAIIAAMACEALAERGDRDVLLAELSSLSEIDAATSWFLYRALEKLVPEDDEAVMGRLVSHIDDSWHWSVHRRRFFNDFAAARLAELGSLRCDDGFEIEAEQYSQVEALLRKLDAAVSESLLADFRRWRSSRFDLEFLSSIGQVDQAGKTRPVEHERFLDDLAWLEHTLGSRTSAVLVGDTGVGKSALIESLARRWLERGQHIFEAGGQELLAGQSFFGQYEARLKDLVEQLRDAPIVWYVPDLKSLLSGTHARSGADALDFLLPYVERREILIVSECEPAAWQRLEDRKPKLARAFERRLIQPLLEEQSLGLAHRWTEPGAPGEMQVEDGLIATASGLAGQFLGDRVAPGNLLQLLDVTRQRLIAIEERSIPERQATHDDLVRALEQLTGLPSSVLDDRCGLDLASLTQAFEAEVLGQREAVGCLVERIAMIKAGVCDGSRPLGVFLFAGPTGTGKTELVKQLASYLFGSEDRMVRLDMSEFQTGDSISRILGDVDSHHVGGALVDQVRKQPFTVVLLDEFEKSAAPIWDLFLQVFDDGRLTDRRGVVTDFRNTIVVMTSNLGAAIPSGSGIGFGEDGAQFSTETVKQQIGKAFRPELLNRIDRVVVFKPFSRQVMRRILRAEVRRAFERRGLKRRQWAVEWDSSATDFLLDRGFSPTLGARPLRRAVEQHLLVPLACLIVDGKVPEGEQFLFVRAGRNKLVVEFVDPDAPPSADPGTSSKNTHLLPLANLAISARGGAAERETLIAALEELDRKADNEALSHRKTNAYQALAGENFWSSSSRFQTLDEINSIDRIESARATIRGLSQRMTQTDVERSAEVHSRLAKKVWLLGRALDDFVAKQPWDCFLAIDAGDTPSEQALDFRDRIVEQYQAWAESRGMQLETLSPTQAQHGSPTSDGRDACIFLVSGFAAWGLLRDDHGVHILEYPDGNRTRRASVRVRVAPQAGGLGSSAQETLAKAREALDAGSEIGIVRRYRDEPSPLVRDGVRGFKTGRIDLVLQGNFDLLAERSEGGSHATDETED